MDETFRLGVERLCFGPNPPAGMNPLVLMSLVYRLQSTTEDPEPVLVTAAGSGIFRVHDGRHRAMAAIIAGRRDVLAAWFRP